MAEADAQPLYESSSARNGERTHQTEPWCVRLMASIHLTDFGCGWIFLPFLARVCGWVYVWLALILVYFLNKSSIHFIETLKAHTKINAYFGVLERIFDQKFMYCVCWFVYIGFLLEIILTVNIFIAIMDPLWDSIEIFIENERSVQRVVSICIMITACVLLRLLLSVIARLNGKQESNATHYNINNNITIEKATVGSLEINQNTGSCESDERNETDRDESIDCRVIYRHSLWVGIAWVMMGLEVVLMLVNSITTSCVLNKISNMKKLTTIGKLTKNLTTLDNLNNAEDVLRISNYPLNWINVFMEACICIPVLMFSFVNYSTILRTRKANERSERKYPLIFTYYLSTVFGTTSLYDCTPLIVFDGYKLEWKSICIRLFCCVIIVLWCYRRFIPICCEMKPVLLRPYTNKGFCFVTCIVVMMASVLFTIFQWNIVQMLVWTAFMSQSAIIVLPSIGHAIFMVKQSNGQDQRMKTMVSAVWGFVIGFTSLMLSMASLIFYELKKTELNMADPCSNDVLDNLRQTLWKINPDLCDY